MAAAAALSAWAKVADAPSMVALELASSTRINCTVAVEPTLHNLAVLAVIVAIRTLLSFALELEVNGRWPWQKGEK